MPRSTKNMLMIAAIAVVVSAGVVLASNRIPAIRRALA